MDLSDFAFKKVGIIGGGIDSLSVIPFLVKQSAQVTICDKNSNNLITEVTEKYPTVKVIIGENYLDALNLYDYIFRSPGTPISVISDRLKESPTKPISTSATDLFLHLSPATTIGITGTKGKGTTSTILGSILQQTSRRTYVVGNIGKPMFEIYSELTDEDIVVLELSSFQLEDVTASPTYAIMLPMGVDHLSPLSERSPNYHKTMEDYVRAKANITAFQKPNDVLVFASDNTYSTEIASNSSARRISVGLNKESDYVYTSEGDFLQNGNVILNFKELGLIGEHVFLDAALATAMALQLEVEIEQIKEGIAKFVPLPHRLEKVATIAGVDYYDDSYATAPDATIYALNAFSQPVVWIGGGSTKGADFTELAEKIVNKCKQAILIGTEAPRIKEAIHKVKPEFPIEECSSIENAVAFAKQAAVTNDVVLLSPACASLDMFKSAADRGEKFLSAVKGSE